MDKVQKSPFNPGVCSREFLHLLAYAYDQMDTLTGITDLNGKMI